MPKELLGNKLAKGLEKIENILRSCADNEQGRGKEKLLLAAKDFKNQAQNLTGFTKWLDIAFGGGETDLNGALKKVLDSVLSHYDIDYLLNTENQDTILKSVRYCKAVWDHANQKKVKGKRQVTEPKEVPKEVPEEPVSNPVNDVEEENVAKKQKTEEPDKTDQEGKK